MNSSRQVLATLAEPAGRRTERIVKKGEEPVKTDSQPLFFTFLRESFASTANSDEVWDEHSLARGPGLPFALDPSIKRVAFDGNSTRLDD